MVSITHRALKTSMPTERPNTHHHTSPRNAVKYTPEVRDGRMIPAHPNTIRHRMNRRHANVSMNVPFS